MHSDSSTTFGIVAAGISIASFLFAVWVWMRQEARVNTARAALETVQETVDQIMLSDDGFHADPATLQARLERTLGQVASIRNATSVALGTTRTALQPEFKTLLAKRLIWTGQMLWAVEAGPTIKAVWIVTPDLQPDVSEQLAAEVVRSNLARGVDYTYFVPAHLAEDQDTIDRLRKNVLPRTRLRRPDRPSASRFNVAVIESPELFAAGGNCVLYFDGPARSGHGAAYHEILFPRLAKRGAFWREVDDSARDTLIGILLATLQKSSPPNQ